MVPRPPVPPFTEETARQKVRAAEDGWNSRDPAKVALAYTEDSRWRNRDEFFSGRAAIPIPFRVRARLFPKFSSFRGCPPSAHGIVRAAGYLPGGAPRRILITSPKPQQE